jgi:hypothetical protein
MFLFKIVKEDKDVRVYDLSSSKSASLKQADWSNVDPITVYKSTQEWYHQ